MVVAGGPSLWLPWFPALPHQKRWQQLPASCLLSDFPHQLMEELRVICSVRSDPRGEVGVDHRTGPAAAVLLPPHLNQNRHHGDSQKKVLLVVVMVVSVGTGPSQFSLSTLPSSGHEGNNSTRNTRVSCG